jgi:hypothetical protein
MHFSRLWLQCDQTKGNETKLKSKTYESQNLLNWQKRKQVPLGFHQSRNRKNVHQKQRQKSQQNSFNPTIQNRIALDD